MVSGDFCEHDWPGSGCSECKLEYERSKKMVNISVANGGFVIEASRAMLAERMKEKENTQNMVHIVLTKQYSAIIGAYSSKEKAQEYIDNSKYKNDLVIYSTILI